MSIRRIFEYILENTHRILASCKKRRKAPSGPAPADKGLSDEESEMIKKRLKELGYIDED
jgi:hypothetical protein